MKLTIRLVLLFFIMSFLPVVALGYLAYSNGQKAIQDNLSTHLMTTTIYKQDEYNRWIDASTEKLVILAQRPLVRDYTTVLMTSDPGQGIYQQAYQDLLDNHLLPNLRDENYLSFSLIQPNDGKIILSTEKHLEGKYREDEPFFLEGQHGPFVDEVRYFLAEEEVALHISTPILDNKGDLLAVLVGHLNLETMSGIMQQGRELLQGEETYLVNPAYFFVTEPWLGQGRILTNTVRTEGVSKCLNQQTGISTYLDYRGVAVIGAYRWMPERNLCIVTEIDQDYALKPVVALRNQTLMLGSVSAFLMAIVGYLISKTITMPISKLVEGTSAVGEGNLAYRIDLNSKDELGQLANAFNEMSAKLSQSQLENDRLFQEIHTWAQELENRVGARTEELRVSEEKFRGAFQFAAIGRAIANIDGQFVQVNNSFCEMLGYNQQELLAKTWQEITHLDYLQKNYEQIEKMMSGQTPSFQMELKLNHKNGAQKLVWVKLAVFLLRNEDGKPEYMIGDIENITERKLAAEALEASEERFRRAIMGAPFPIMIHAEDGEVVTINRTWTDITGYSHEEIPTTVVWARKAYGQDMEIVQEEIDHLYGLSEPVSEGEYTITTAKGDSVIWDFSSAGLGRLPDGRRIVISMAMDVTNRKKAEIAIREEKALSDSLINSMPGIFYLFDMQGKFLRWNKYFEKVSGYSNSEMTKLNPLDFFEGKEKELVENEIRKVFEFGNTDIEADFISKDGKRTPYLLTGLRLALGGSQYLVGTGMDITKRKDMERSIQESEERYRLLSETSPDMIFVIDRDDNVTYVNKLAASQFGKTSDQVIGKKRTALFPPRVAEAQKPGILHVFQSGETVSAESPIVFPDGVIWLGTKLVPIRDRTGKVSAVMGVSRDITERIQFQEKLRSINERFELATHSAKLGIWDWDVVNNILVWDDLMYELYGVDPEDFSGAYEAWLEGLHPDDAAQSNNEVQMALRGEKKLDSQFRVVWPDGTLRYLKANALVMRDSNGEPLRMIGINYDITELILAQEKLEQSNLELARSNTELERFAYVASHDLQEPLRMVTSYLQLLERRYKDRLDGDALEFIKYAVDGSTRMKTLINDLLAYSRVATRGKDFKPINCDSVIERVLLTLKPAMDKTHAQITLDDLPTILGDETQIEQLFQNLIGNAIKFHGEKPPRVHLGVTKDNETWLFSVRDNGIGIDPQFYERVFIIFQRLHTIDKYKGTGIGLAISKRIVERHGGQIWIESEPGKGSTFYFTIPMKGA